MYYYDTLTTPLGDLMLACNDAGALTHLYMGSGAGSLPERLRAERSPERLAAWKRQLSQYFTGERQTFDLPFEGAGTDFQKAVWAHLLTIPFGETRSYGQIAAALGVPNASRAVGRANGTNPISIIVPCHRVVGASGALTGYGGGLDNKRWLLEFEANEREGSLGF